MRHPGPRPCFVVSGTDTDVGKTIFAAGLAAALDGSYWKPVQAGLAGETDTEIVLRLSGLPKERMLPEVYRLTTAASPHLAAERDRVEIDVGRLTVPETSRPLVVEGAGGLLVPLTREFLQIDLFARWAMPVILCASTRLGTINHSLLSIEALKRRSIPMLGIVFVGEPNADSERTIVEMGGVHRLGRLPWLDPLDAASLRAAFEASFRRANFLAGVPS
jgi:dethiobiotin synthetase